MQDLANFKKFIVQIRVIIRENLKLLLISWTFCLFLIGFYYSQNADFYKSTVSFYIEDDYDFSISEGVDNPMEKFKSNNIGHQIKSSNMIDFLIKKFNLYKEYDISKANPYHYEKLNQQLMKQIDVKESPSGAILVTVSDKNKDLAMSMANEIFVKLDSSLRNQFAYNLERRVKIYGDILKNVKSKAVKQNQQLESLLANFKTITSGNAINKINNENIIDINNKLSTLSFEVSNLSNDLAESLENYEIAANILKDEKYVRIKLINRALVDLNSPIRSALIKAVLVSGLTFCCLTIVLFFYSKIKSL